MVWDVVQDFVLNAVQAKKPKKYGCAGLLLRWSFTVNMRWVRLRDTALSEKGDSRLKWLWMK